MRLALFLLLALACSSQNDKAAPAPAPVPMPSGDAECASDSDCATTTYAPEAVTDKGGCCAALACSRVETAKRARELADAWTGACAAVRCRAPDCPAGSPDPVAACKAGRCGPR